MIRLGITYDLSGDYGNGAKLFKRVIALHPSYDYGYANLGVALEGLGDFEGAKDAYETAVNMIPKNRKYRKNLRDLLKTMRTNSTSV